MKVKELLKDFLELNFSTTVAEAAKMMEAKSTGSAMVKRENQIIGIITERDILKRIVAGGRDPNTTTIENIMSSPVITISEEASITEASELMDKNRIRRLAVVDNTGKIIGKITANIISRNFKYMIGRDLLRDRYYRDSGGPLLK